MIKICFCNYIIQLTDIRFHLFAIIKFFFLNLIIVSMDYNNIYIYISVLIKVLC